VKANTQNFVFSRFEVCESGRRQRGLSGIRDAGPSHDSLWADLRVISEVQNSRCGFPGIGKIKYVERWLKSPLL